MNNFDISDGNLHQFRYYDGPEYISHTLTEWAEREEIKILFIQPGKPTQNAYVERFNR
ncbi:MAG: transposase family protein, partial [Shewanella frigidimarina]|nr:transposase family protein [Shewanella frigidimarina]